MKRIGLIILISFVLIQQLSAQEIDSLRLLLKTEKVDSSRLKLYGKLGYIYLKSSNYDSAYYFYRKSNIIAKELLDTSKIIVNQFNISKVFYWMSFYEKADSLLKESMKLAVIVNDTTSQANLYTSLGVNSLKMRDTIVALDYFAKVLSLYGNENLSGKGNIYANLGQIYRSQNKLDKALIYFSLSEEMWEQLNMTPKIARIQFEKAKVFYAQKNYKKAIEFYQNSLLLDSINPFKTIQSWKYKRLSEAYLKINKFDSAYYFLEKHYLMQKEIYSAEKTRNIKEIELKYQTELKEQENISLKKENLLNKKIIKNKDYLFTGSMLLIFLIILIIIILYRSYKNIKKSNLVLEQQQKDIVSQSEILEESNHKLKELSQYKRTLTNMLIHDLSNPLHIIKSSTTDSNITNTANQMIIMIDNLLSIQKLKDKQVKIEFFNYQLSYLSEKTIQQTDSYASKKNIQLINNINPSIFVNTDSFMIERVIINLITNAIRFTKEQGEIILDAKLVKTDTIELSVTDNGIGIEEKNIENIFDKYAQQDSKSKNNYGIGLSFCKLAVEAMGGTIGVRSVLGKGSTFYFTLKGEQKDLLNSNKTSEKQKAIVFTEVEKQQISEYLINLQQYEIYELTDIKKILKKIKKIEGENIKNWITLFENALYASNQELYQQLIDIK